jgi:hypothetical protein
MGSENASPKYLYENLKRHLLLERGLLMKHVDKFYFIAGVCRG